jgi:hypothetical protein
MLARFFAVGSAASQGAFGAGGAAGGAQGQAAQGKAPQHVHCRAQHWRMLGQPTLQLPETPANHSAGLPE